jgi:uncharacterized protein with LGFP repeats
MSRWPTRDWVREEEARDLAAKVERYWAERGEVVRTTVYPMTDPCKGNGAMLWGISSDMVNGLPRRGA